MRLPIAFVLLVAAGCSSPPALPLEIGAEIGMTDSATRTGPSLLWVLESEDHLRCETDARAIRHLQLRRDVPLTVYAVDADVEWIRSFLASERLDAALVSISPGEFQARYDRKAASALYVIHDGAIAAAFLSGRGEFATAPLEEAFRSLIDVH